MAERFRDPGLFVELLWAQPIQVRCPVCSALAVVTPAPGDDRPLYHRGVKARLTCPACAYSAETDKPFRRDHAEAPIDPFFGADLFLQGRCEAHTLWAFNEAHLDLIAHYVAADLRERARFADIQSAMETLPRWIKEAKNRDAIERSVQRMRFLVASASKA